MADSLPSLQVRRAGSVDRLVLSRMLELYQHDLSDLWDQDLDPHGEFGYQLDRYFRQNGDTPWLFLVDGQFAGFALVDNRVRIPGDDFWMDQFFVMKKYRRRGVGAAAARTVLAAHPGRWQVGQMPLNLSAQDFWRRTIGAFTGGRFTEGRVDLPWWQGPVQRFEVLR